MSKTLEYARRRVKEFANEQWIEDHNEAMDCQDCDALLLLGIEAYKWLVKADLAFHQYACIAPDEYASGAQVIEQLFKDWLARTTFIHEWIDVQHQRGFELEHLEEFRECERDVKSVVRAFQSESSLPPRMADLRDEAIQEHRDGKTSEFI